MSAPDIIQLHRQAQQALNRRAYEDAHRCCIEILEREPEFADAYFLLGMIALEHGRAGKARELIDRALALKPDSAEYLAHRAKCLVSLKDYSAALQSAREALALAPDDALTLDTIAVALTKAGDHETAIGAFMRAVDRQPENPRFHFNLASSQEFLGDFSAAEESYERAIRLRPDFYRAHWALSELTHATPEKNHVERLERLLDTANPDADGNLYLCHALAKEYDELGQHPKAFTYLQRGKGSKRGRVSFSVAGHQALFETITAVCSAEFCASDEPGYESSEPIFIVGMPRSGTTLVERILAGHDDVFAAGELSEFGLSLKRAVGTETRQVLDVETTKGAASLNFAQVGKDYIASTRPRTGHSKHFIDKLPPNALYAGFIRRALPAAKIICLRRNPLDTCLSNYRQLLSIDAPYYDYTYDLLDTGRYYLMFDALIKHWARVLPSNFLVVHYEDMVDDVEREARKVLEFCALPWDPKVLEFHTGKTPVATASAVQVREPLYRTSVGRWKKYERELAPLMELFARHGVAYE
jgi:tetratricopeptide (TPR) repeat protein